MIITYIKKKFHSFAAKMLLFMLLFAAVLLIAFSIPVIAFLNRNNINERNTVNNLNAGYVNILLSNTLEQLSTASVDSSIISAVVTPDSSENSKKQSMAQVSLSRLNNANIYTDMIVLLIAENNTVITSDYGFGTPSGSDFEYISHFLNTPPISLTQ